MDGEERSGSFHTLSLPLGELVSQEWETEN